MILVVDVGNTNTVLGLFRDRQLIRSWRVATNFSRTEDEYGILFNNLFSYSSINSSEIRGMSLACVVPPMLDLMVSMAKKYLHLKPLVVGPGIKTGMPIMLDNPREIGADRIVNAVAAYQQHKQSLVVIDFGTATTFDCVSAKGEYLGGIIAPGLQISIEALFQRASKLPRVEMIRPREVVGKNTVHSMQSGIVYGYLSLVEGLVSRISHELQTEPLVIATGGLAPLIARETATIDQVDELLTLDGLLYLYELNRS
ncbi:MAG: type III pantothenate kinase [Deltaproteobacteria bacterium]|nr:type III pantothenate kinase [Candidatus Anaeroferrophillus wilburensis]MBN2888453.1 type III pantothenate kinase [Deltaproteobacteria bacterium]